MLQTKHDVSDNLKKSSQRPMMISVPLVVALPLFFFLMVLGLGYLHAGVFERLVLTNTRGYPTIIDVRAALRIIYSMTWILSLMFTLVGLVWAYALLMPLRRIAHQLNEMVAQNELRSLSVDPLYELSFLGESFNRMIAYTSTFLPERTRAMLQRITSGVITLEATGVVESVNRSAEELLGMQMGDAPGHPIEEVLRQGRDDEFACLIKKLLSNHEDLAGAQVRWVTPEGETKAIGVSAAWMSGNLGRATGLVINLMDAQRMDTISDGFRKTEKLSWVGALAAGVAHDIRNPLATLKGLSQLMLEQELPSERRETYLKTMLEESERVNTVVERLMAFARPERVTDKNINLEEVAREASHLASNRRLETEIPVVVEPVQEAIPMVCVQPERMTQALFNVITNAQEAADEGSVVRVRVGWYAEHSKVGIAVENKGQVLSNEDIESIFLPFYTTKEKALGLGLTITAAVLGEYQGTVKVESAYGATTFHLILGTEVIETS